MAKYLLNRAIQILVTLFVFLSIVFFLVNAQPGDASNFYALSPDIPPETREKLRELFGVNQPLWKQYLIHVKNTLTGNFGVSFSLYPRSVSEVIMERLPRTLMLFVTASVLSFYLGFSLGKIIAWRRGGWTEYTSTLRRRITVHGLHPLVCPHDDLAVRVQGRLVPYRQVPRSSPVARRPGRR